MEIKTFLKRVWGGLSDAVAGAGAATTSSRPSRNTAPCLTSILAAVGDPLGDPATKQEARRTLDLVLQRATGEERGEIMASFSRLFEQNLGASSPRSMAVATEIGGRTLCVVLCAHGGHRKQTAREAATLLEKHDLHALSSELAPLASPLGAIAQLSFFPDRSGVSMFFTLIPIAALDGHPVEPPFDALVLHPNIFAILSKKHPQLLDVAARGSR